MMSPKQARRAAVRATKRYLDDTTDEHLSAAHRAVDRFFAVSSEDTLRVPVCVTFRGRLLCTTFTRKRPEAP